MTRLWVIVFMVMRLLVARKCVVTQRRMTMRRMRRKMKRTISMWMMWMMQHRMALHNVHRHPHINNPPNQHSPSRSPIYLAIVLVAMKRAAATPMSRLAPAPHRNKRICIRIAFSDLSMPHAPPHHLPLHASICSSSVDSNKRRPPPPLRL